MVLFLNQKLLDNHNPCFMDDNVICGNDCCINSLWFCPSSLVTHKIVAGKVIINIYGLLSNII